MYDHDTSDYESCGVSMNALKCGKPQWQTPMLMQLTQIQLFAVNF